MRPLLHVIVGGVCGTRSGESLVRHCVSTRERARVRVHTHARGSSRAFALVVVLSVLRILSVLIIAFLGSPMTDIAASKTQENSRRVQLLADSVPQIVMSRISDATAGGVTAGESRFGGLGGGGAAGGVSTL